MLTWAIIYLIKSDNARLFKKETADDLLLVAMFFDLMIVVFVIAGVGGVVRTIWGR